MPPYVGVPTSPSTGLRPGYFGGNFLGMHRDPFQSSDTPEAKAFEVSNINLPEGLSLHRLKDRRTLYQSLDRLRRDFESSAAFESLDEFDRQAYEIVAGSAARRRL